MSLIKHKFDLGEEIFTLKNDKVVNGIILNITLQIPPNEQPTVIYTVGITLSFAKTTYSSLFENEIFKTKEDLLKSL